MTDTGRPEHGGETPDFFGPLERSGTARGWLLVAGAVVIGALLLPSATRANLSGKTTAATATTAGPSSSPAATIPPPTSSTTSSSTTTSAPATLAPSSIRVLVANGTNTTGAAAAVSSFLSGKGYSMLTPIDALTVVPATEVYAVDGAFTAARQVAASLGLAATSVEPASQPVPVTAVGNAVVVVVVGPDLTSRS